MRTRVLALLVAVSALAARAQELDLSDFRPATVGVEVEVTQTPQATTPLPGCVSESDCATGFICSGDRSRWLRGVCEPARRTSCAAASECAQGFICSGFQPQADGKWSRGSCQDGRAGSTCAGPRDCARGFACTGKSGTCQESTGLLSKRTADEPDRFKFRGTVPEGFHLVTEARQGAAKWSFVGGGIGLLTASYLVSAGLALSFRQYGGLVPVAGPIALLSEAWQSLNGARFTDGYVYKGLAILGCVVDVAAQVTGIVMLMVGLLSPSRWLERDVAKPSVALVPGAAGAAVGTSLVGRF